MHVVNLIPAFLRIAGDKRQRLWRKNSLHSDACPGKWDRASVSKRFESSGAIAYQYLGEPA